jgi:hypothetical protein
VDEFSPHAPRRLLSGRRLFCLLPRLGSCFVARPRMPSLPPSCPLPPSPSILPPSFPPPTPPDSRDSLASSWTFPPSELSAPRRAKSKTRAAEPSRLSWPRPILFVYDAYFDGNSVAPSSTTRLRSSRRSGCRRNYGVDLAPDHDVISNREGPPVPPAQPGRRPSTPVESLVTPDCSVTRSSSQQASRAARPSQCEWCQRILVRPASATARRLQARSCWVTRRATPIPCATRLLNLSWRRHWQTHRPTGSSPGSIRGSVTEWCWTLPRCLAFPLTSGLYGWASMSGASKALSV